jgi:hypothetical protein
MHLVWLRGRDMYQAVGLGDNGIVDGLAKMQSQSQSRVMVVKSSRSATAPADFRGRSWRWAVSGGRVSALQPPAACMETCMETCLDNDIIQSIQMAIIYET